MTRKALMLAFCLTPFVGAQARLNQKADRGYEKATEMTLQATVEAVTERAEGGRSGMGIHLLVQANATSYDVHIGPQFFLAERQWTFARGDRIEITGSKVKFEGMDAVIAREVKRGGQTLVLRDSAGVPKWSGGGRRK